jgi:uncharacterized protein YjiS (DUF1127 family)
MLLITLFQAVQSALKAMRIERQLSHLDDRTLADIGLTRSGILAAAMEKATA